MSKASSTSNTGGAKAAAKSYSVNDIHEIFRNFQQTIQKLEEENNKRCQDAYQTYMEKQALLDLAEKNAFYSAQMARENYETQIRIARGTLDPPSFEKQAQSSAEQLNKALTKIFEERDKALKGRNDAFQAHSETVRKVSAAAKDAQKEAFDAYLKQKADACNEVPISQLSPVEIIEFGNLLVGMGHELSHQKESHP